MTDSTALAQFVSALNESVFFREFSFSGSLFTPHSGTQVELADHLVRVGDLAFVFQLKERDPFAQGTLDKWIRDKVQKRATRQVRSTIAMPSEGPVVVANARGNSSDVAITATTTVHKFVVFSSPSGRTPLPFPKLYKSSTVGLIHIVDAPDYLGLCQHLLTPMEIADYFTWRAAQVEAHPVSSTIPEEALLGQYLIEDNGPPSPHFSRVLSAMAVDLDSFELSWLFDNLGERVTYSTANSAAEAVIPLLTVFAQLTRLELKYLKERLRYALDAVKEDRYAPSTRMHFERLSSGILIIPIDTTRFDQRFKELRVLGSVAKYDQQATSLIALAVARDGPQIALDWAFLTGPWEFNQALADRLAEGSPLSPLKPRFESRYLFHTDLLNEIADPRDL